MVTTLMSLTTDLPLLNKCPSGARPGEGRLQGPGRAWLLAPGPRPSPLQPRPSPLQCLVLLLAGNTTALRRLRLLHAALTTWLTQEVRHGVEAEGPSLGTDVVSEAQSVLGVTTPAGMTLLCDLWLPPAS